MTSARSAVALVLVLAGAARAAAPAGWRFSPGKPGMPAVLLIHGLAASSGHWTDPGSTWSIKSGHFKHWKKPRAHSGRMTAPTVKGAIESVALSPVNKSVHEADSFFTALSKAGFTVATWDQVPCMATTKVPDQACLDSDVFETAWPSSRAALAELARLTDPATPIALVGHSRGGLVARRLLKEKDVPGLDRVRWNISLHTPHHGSSMATKGAALKKKLKAMDAFDDLLDLDFVPKAERKAVKKLLPDVGAGLADTVDALVVLTGLKGAAELAEGGPLYTALEADEVLRPNVQYVTFGGSSPRVARVHARVYDGSLTGDWTTSVKQLFDFPADLKLDFDEMKKGGDLLVTDKSAHFRPGVTHVRNPLNHAEVLWNDDVQKDVIAILSKPTAQAVDRGDDPKADEDDDEP